MATPAPSCRAASATALVARTFEGLFGGRRHHDSRNSRSLDFNRRHRPHYHRTPFPHPPGPHGTSELPSPSGNPHRLRRCAADAGFTARPHPAFCCGHYRTNSGSARSPLKRPAQSVQRQPPAGSPTRSDNFPIHNLGSEYRSPYPLLQAAPGRIGPATLQQTIDAIPPAISFSQSIPIDIPPVGIPASLNGISMSEVVPIDVSVDILGHHHRHQDRPTQAFSAAPDPSTSRSSFRRCRASNSARLRRRASSNTGGGGGSGIITSARRVSGNEPGLRSDGGDALRPLGNTGGVLNSGVDLRHVQREAPRRR